jgi:hypothetical protein
MNIEILDVEEHGEKGSPLPYWIRFSEVDILWKLPGIISQITETVGRYSFLPSADSRWSCKYSEGHVVAMFKTAEDRLLARFSIS